MSQATSSIFPIQNGKLLSNLNANNFQIENLDTSNLPSGGGGGNDTGTTTAILKGDGNHGFADAVADTDYASVSLVGTKENSSDHDTDIDTINTALALKANSADMTTALDAKADTTALATGLATKEPLLPTTANDGWILARHDDDSWFFVDPVTLGTTNQSFNDGESATDTSWVSASANFSNDDVGLSITGDNIAAATTIASVTDDTTIVLSQATTGTGTGLNFVILNRLTVSGGGSGTVTDVSLLKIGNALFDNTNLFSSTSTVTNPSTSAAISLLPNNSVPARRIYGNSSMTSAGPAGFMTPAAAQAALGGGTAGIAIFGLTGPPPTPAYVRVTAGNAAQMRIASDVITDIGAEVALTFSAPLTRTGGNTISIPAATALVSGHLSSTDWGTFNSKVPPARSISTTAPLQIAGATPVGTTYTADLSANRTLLMPRATSTVDGYMGASDFFIQSNLAPKPENAPTAGGNYTVTVGSGPNGTPVISRIQLVGTLTNTLTIILPPAANYNNYTGAQSYLEIVDMVSPGPATANFGIILAKSTLPLNNDLVDNVASLTLPKGIGYLRLNSNGLNRWSTTKYYVDSFKDPTDPTQKVVVDVSGVTGTRTLKFADGDQVTVIPTPGGTGGAAPTFMTGVTAAGVPTYSTVAYSDLTGTPTAPDPSFQTLTDAAVITLTCDQTRNTQNSRVVINGNRLLDIQNLFDGAHGEIRVTQGAGAPFTLSTPNGTRTPSNGLGLITLSGTAGAVDKVRWSYGTTEGILMEVAGSNYTAALCNTLADAWMTTGSGTAIVGSGSGNVAYAGKFIPTSSYTSCKITLDLAKVGSPTDNFVVQVFADDGVTSGGKPTGSALATSAAVASSTFSASPTIATVTFPNFAYAFTSGTIYWVTLFRQGVGDGANNVVWGNNTAATFFTYRAAAAEATWTQASSGIKMRFSVYK